MATKAKTARTSVRKVARKPAKETPPPEEEKKSGISLRVAAIMVLGPLAAIAIGLYMFFFGGRYVSTDNAYVKSEKIAISSDVSGRVVGVGVKQNQLIEKDALLFKLDPEPFRIALQQAEARLMATRHEVEAQRALHRQKQAELTLAEGDVTYYERQFERQQRLNERGFASGTNLDTADRNLRNSRDRIATIKQDIAQALAKLAGDITIPTDKQPSVLEAMAIRDKAALDLNDTEIRAPAAGVVTNFDLQVGEYVEAGNVTFSIVASGKLWVDANFKETKLTNVRVGQPATLLIDAYPNDERKAVVASISAATGAEFALLPPQNATGNWVKVVQRLPVRLKLDQPLRDPPLRAGMSVVVEIDTGKDRDWSDLMLAARNYVRGLL